MPSQAESSSPEALVALLETDDVRVQRRAGDALVSHGLAAIPYLAEALVHGSPTVRKAVAFLLGRVSGAAESPRALSALGHAVTDDPEPKVRKNAAMSLGKIAAPAAAEPLASALSRETITWVRPSIALALGSVGGETAHASLLEAIARDDAEHEAIRKALDRVAPKRRAVTWRRDMPWRHDLVLTVPAGLEAVALAEAAELGFHALTLLGPGQLWCPQEVPPWDVLPAMRCVSALHIRAGVTGRLGMDEPQDLAAAVGALLASSPQLRELRDWLQVEGETIRYRFSFANARLRREDLAVVLWAVRAVCRPMGLVDSPSNYDLALVVSLGPKGTELLIGPSFTGDERFAYRRAAVGASIDPVLAACLARLVRTKTGRGVFDPTCGSGALLIERARLGAAAGLQGLDISPTAIRAARENIGAAGLSGLVRVQSGDAADRDRWPECDEVIANLPFGVRTRRPEADLDGLYRAVVGGIAARIRSGGRAVLYTSNRKSLNAALARHTDRLRVLDRLKTRSGGLDTHIWILTPQDKP